jgi:DNA-binding NarL/FixJ family response regulator
MPDWCAGAPVVMLRPMHGPAASQRPGRPAAARAGRVLGVIGDPAVREQLARVAEHGGYGVVTSPSAETATVLLAVPGHGFGAVVTDAELPGTVDGLVLARWVADAQPGLAVIVTGASEDALEAAHAIPSVRAVVARREAARRLLGHLRAVLGS